MRFSTITILTCAPLLLAACSDNTAESDASADGDTVRSSADAVPDGDEADAQAGPVAVNFESFEQVAAAPDRQGPFSIEARVSNMVLDAPPYPYLGFGEDGYDIRFYAEMDPSFTSDGHYSQVSLGEQVTVICTGPVETVEGTPVFKGCTYPANDRR